MPATASARDTTGAENLVGWRNWLTPDRRILLQGRVAEYEDECGR